MRNALKNGALVLAIAVMAWSSSDVVFATGSADGYAAQTPVVTAPDPSVPGMWSVKFCIRRCSSTAAAWINGPISTVHPSTAEPLEVDGEPAGWVDLDGDGGIDLTGGTSHSSTTSTTNGVTCRDDCYTQFGPMPAGPPTKTGVSVKFKDVNGNDQVVNMNQSL